MTKIWVAPESAMESFVLRLKTALAKAGAGKDMLVLWEVQVLDATKGNIVVIDLVGGV
jgi:hypothetical protein